MWLMVYIWSLSRLCLPGKKWLDRFVELKETKSKVEKIVDLSMWEVHVVSRCLIIFGWQKCSVCEGCMKDFGTLYCFNKVIILLKIDIVLEWIVIFIL